MCLTHEIERLRTLLPRQPEAALAHFLRLAGTPGFHLLGHPLARAPRALSAIVGRAHTHLMQLPGLEVVHGLLTDERGTRLLLWLGAEHGGLVVPQRRGGAPVVLAPTARQVGPQIRTRRAAPPAPAPSAWAAATPAPRQGRRASPPPRSPPPADDPDGTSPGSPGAPPRR
jgi:hypothetical protein